MIDANDYLLALEDYTAEGYDILFDCKGKMVSEYLLKTIDVRLEQLHNHYKSLGYELPKLYPVFNRDKDSAMLMASPYISHRIPND